MPQTIKVKQTAVTGRTPTTAQLQLGELAVNTYDGRLFLKQNLNGVETMLMLEARAVLGPDHDPFAEAGREAVNVEVLNVVRRSDRTFDLQWRETRFINGQQAGAERWRALITVAHQPPRDEAELMRNPLGLKIEDVSWTPDAS